MCVCLYAGSIIFRAYKIYGNHDPSTCTKRKTRMMSSRTTFPRVLNGRKSTEQVIWHTVQNKAFTVNKNDLTI